MRVMIITTPLGQGHNSAAKAISKYFMEKKVETVTIDLYEYIQPKLKEIVSKGYYFSMKSASLVKDLATDIYDLNEKRDITSEYSLTRIKNRLLASELMKFIGEYGPDFIICTQVYAAQVVDVLKEKGMIKALAVGIITDFTVQTYWEDVEHFEYIVVGSERLENQLQKRGITMDRVLPFGIPIDEKFSIKKGKENARSSLGLEQDRKTILIMSGGMGFGNIEKYIAEIDQSKLNVQMIVVCGSNKRLYEKVQKIQTVNPVLKLGFTDKVELLMDAADCILTKPGGITTSESLAKGLPMIMIDPLPGVEDRNVEFLLNNGASLMVSKTFTIEDSLHLLFDWPQRLESIHTAISSIAKPDSTKNLCDFLINKYEERHKNDK